MISRRLFLSAATSTVLGTTVLPVRAQSTFSMTEYLKELRELIAIDSKSGHVEGVNRIADIFENRFKSIGWTVARHDSQGKGDILLASNTSDQSQFDVLISAHSDTVQPIGHAQKYPLRWTGTWEAGQPL